MSDKVGHITWHRTSNTTWATVNPKRDGDYTGTITEGAKPDPYALEILPGPVNSSHPTLKAAKDEFRRFLFDKPVRT